MLQHELFETTVLKKLNISMSIFVTEQNRFL